MPCCSCWWAAMRSGGSPWVAPSLPRTWRCGSRSRRPSSVSQARSGSTAARAARARARNVPLIAAKLEALGLILPKAVRPPAGVVLPFRLVRVRGDRAYVSGHGPLNADGTLAPPLGKVGRDLSVEQGYRAARLTALAMLGSIERELGDLERVKAWTRVFGMVNSAPGFNQQPRVMNGFSDLILELFGPERGAHSRSAVGMAELPFDLPVEIEAELEIEP